MHEVRRGRIKAAIGAGDCESEDAGVRATLDRLYRAEGRWRDSHCFRSEDFGTAP